MVLENKGKEKDLFAYTFWADGMKVKFVLSVHFGHRKRECSPTEPLNAPVVCLWNLIRHLLSIFITGNLHLLHWTGTEETEDNNDLRVKIRSSHTVSFHLSQFMNISVSGYITYALWLNILKLLFSTQSSADNFKLIQMLFAVQLFCSGTTYSQWSSWKTAGETPARSEPLQGGVSIRCIRWTWHDLYCFWCDSLAFCLLVPASEVQLCC